MSKWFALAVTCFAFSAAFAEDTAEVVAGSDVVVVEDATAASDEVSGGCSEETAPVLNRCSCGKGK